MMQLPELFIFDMDGLLFDTERLFMNKRAEILPEYGYVHREEDYIRTLGTSGDQLLRILAEIYDSDYPADEISQRSRVAQLAHMREHGAPVKDGIKDLLVWIAKNKVPCCVATSTAAVHADEILMLGDIRQYFSFIIGGDQVSHSKPHPEIFLTACKAGGVVPEKAVVLEDSENGILAADAAGIPVICIPDMKYPDADIAKKTAAIVKTAADVITLFMPESL
ncbi:MAG: HAD family phosphatase [Lachnospiraceae bacterium]|nr:HAD family phosphatase [Lachnospiraceae bacterium]